MPVLLACVRELSNQHRACARTTTVYRIGPAIHTARISKFVLKYSVGTGVLAMCSHVGSVTMCVLSSAYTHACSGRLPVRPLWSQTRVSPCICIHSGLRPQTRVSPCICIRRACRLVYMYTLRSQTRVSRSLQGFALVTSIPTAATGWRVDEGSARCPALTCHIHMHTRVYTYAYAYAYACTRLRQMPRTHLG